MAKATCRNKGRCFVVPKEPKPQRSLKERVAREFARIPRNLRRIFFTPPAPPQKKIALKPVEKNYAEWVAEHEPTADDLEKQRRESNAWDRRPKISLLIPLFDPPAEFLNQLFASVVAQTYENWEACVVDGGSKNREMLESLRRWMKADARIRVQRLEENLGISENTNRALRVATGDFVALVDHDDALAPFALYELASAIRRRPAADIFYSDEDRLCESGERARPFFKPEWSPELLYSFMYIGHLSAYRRELALAMGGFRQEFNLSQDYDFALRATEQAREIVHIPHVLYHWREHAASGASGGKPEARKTNIAALVDAVKRARIECRGLGISNGQSRTHVFAKSDACFRHHPDRLSDTGREMRTRFASRERLRERGVHHRDQHRVDRAAPQVSRTDQQSSSLRRVRCAFQLFRKMQRRRSNGRWRAHNFS